MFGPGVVLVGMAWAGAVAAQSPPFLPAPSPAAAAQPPATSGTAQPVTAKPETHGQALTPGSASLHVTGRIVAGGGVVSDSGRDH